MLKRVSAFAVALAMLLSMVCSVAVVSAETPDVTLALTPVETETQRGDTVQVALSLVNHTAWASLDVQGTYDSTLLEEGSFEFATGAVPVANVREDGTYTLAWATFNDLPAAAETLLGTFTFKVKEDAPISTDEAAVYANITAVIADAGASGPVILSFDTTVQDAKVKITCEHDISVETAEGNQDGTHTGTCTICGKTAVDTCSFEATDPSGATCLLTCTKCGDTKVDSDGTHITKEHYYAPTPDVAGKIVYECDVCGEEVVDADHVKTDLPAGYRFPDLTDTEIWYYDAGLFCASYEIIRGTGAGTFAATDNVTRGTVATTFSRMLLNLLGTSEDEIKAMSDNEFDLFLEQVVAQYAPSVAPVELVDVDGTWFERHAKILAATGIIGGKPGGIFDGNANITRQEFALMSQRLINLVEKMKDTSYGTGAFGVVTPAFADQALIPDWAADGVEWARDRGLMGGTFGNFNPTNVATRAELATLMMRIKVVVNDIVVHL